MDGSGRVHEEVPEPAVRRAPLCREWWSFHRTWGITQPEPKILSLFQAHRLYLALFRLVELRPGLQTGQLPPGWLLFDSVSCWVHERSLQFCWFKSIRFTIGLHRPLAMWERHSSCSVITAIYLFCSLHFLLSVSFFLESQDLPRQALSFYNPLSFSQVIVLPNSNVIHSVNKRSIYQISTTCLSPLCPSLVAPKWNIKKNKKASVSL